jgi:hypothetical protein
MEKWINGKLSSMEQLTLCHPAAYGWAPTWALMVSMSVDGPAIRDVPVSRIAETLVDKMDTEPTKTASKFIRQ